MALRMAMTNKRYMQLIMLVGVLWALMFVTQLLYAGRGTATLRTDGAAAFYGDDIDVGGGGAVPVLVRAFNDVQDTVVGAGGGGGANGGKAEHGHRAQYGSAEDGRGGQFIKRNNGGGGGDGGGGERQRRRRRDDGWESSNATYSTVEERELSQRQRITRDEWAAADGAAALFSDDGGGGGGGGGTGGDGEPALYSNPAIVIIAYNRPEYLRQLLHTLSQLVSEASYAVYISIDGHNPDVIQCAREFIRVFTERTHTFHSFVVRERDHVPRLDADQSAAAYVAQHYEDILNYLFYSAKSSEVIVVEEDLDLSPDFLRLFERTAPLLARDPSLWCVSAWNDNGFQKLVDDEERLERTNFFPGLGWMLRKRTWDELAPKWPQEHWDHWMRLNETSRGRECIYPEVPRTYHMGRQGAHILPHHYTKYFERIRPSKGIADFDNLSYLLEEQYNRELAALARRATIVMPRPNSNSPIPRGNYRVALVPYRRESFDHLADFFGIFSPPRGGHNGNLKLKRGGKTYVLADQRRSLLLPPEHRIRPKANLLPRRGEPGMSCDDICSIVGFDCDDTQFEYVNTCSMLRRFYQCDRGCSMSITDGAPGYVSREHDPMEGLCVVTELIPMCDAAERRMARVCPCLTPESIMLAYTGNMHRIENVVNEVYFDMIKERADVWSTDDTTGGGGGGGGGGYYSSTDPRFINDTIATIVEFASATADGQEGSPMFVVQS